MTTVDAAPVGLPAGGSLATGTPAAGTRTAAGPPRRAVAAARRVRAPAWALRAISPLALVVLWQAGSRSGTIPDRILPSPTAILAAAAETYRDGTLASALAVSAGRAATGFALGATVGLVLGVLVGSSRLLDHVIDPPLQMIRTIPFLGLIPLFIAWFGIGETPKIAMVALGVTFPLYLNTSAAIRQVDPLLLETAQVLRFSPARRIGVVIVPSILPQVLVGLRQSLGIAWLSLIVAEQVNADAGLGYLITTADQSLRRDILVFGLLLYALLGLGTDAVVRLLERRALRWRPEPGR